MVFNVSNKVALITGAASGFGKDLSERLASRGSKIVASDINETDGTAVVHAINSRYGKGTAIFVKCDVSRSEEVDALFKKAVEAFGRLDIVVNNAGISEIVTLASEPGQKWRKIISINLNAVIQGTELAIMQMTKQSPRGGVVINTASMAGFLPSALLPVYTGSKHGVVGFTRSLGRTFTRETGVRVNAIAPAFAETGMTKDALKEATGEMRAMLNRIGTITVAQVVDAFMLAIEDESLCGDVIKITPRHNAEVHGRKQSAKM
ncbi:hypothetical protein HDU67_005544 [Dinochytrium kinnereticum]|nr:hypothetical protein HDU67_005544 [Dinochytrium kinnereticum]